MPVFKTDNFGLVDPADQSKEIAFDISAMTTATRGRIIIPNSPSSGYTMVVLEKTNIFSVTEQFGDGLVVYSGQAGASFNVNGATIDSVYDLSAAQNPGQLRWLETSGSKIGTLTAAAVSNSPGWLLPNLTGGIVLVGNDPPAVAAGAMGKVDITGRTTAIGATNLTNNAAAGYFTVHYALTVTTADVTAGTIQLGIAYTDDLGATTQAGAALVLTATGRQSGSFNVYLASGELSYNTALVGIMGTAQYAVRLRVVSLG